MDASGAHYAALRALDALHARALAEVEAGLKFRENEVTQASLRESLRSRHLPKPDPAIKPPKQVHARPAAPLVNAGASPLADAGAAVEDVPSRPKRARTQRQLQPGMLDGDLALALMKMPDVQGFRESPQHLICPKKAMRKAIERPKLDARPATHAYEGVRFNSRQGRRQASIYVEGSENMLGYCDTQLSAVQHYDEAAHALGRMPKFSKPVGVGKGHAPTARGASQFQCAKEVDGGNVLRDIDHGGKELHLAHFDDEDDAVLKYGEAEAPLVRPLKFAREGQLQAVEGNRKGSSRFKGVNWLSNKKHLEAQIRIDGKVTHLGSFDNEEEAARKYDEAAAHLGRPLNFPVEGQLEATKGASSRFKGVSWYSKTNKFVAQINVHGKGTHLGYFDDEEEAARKYDEAAAPLGRPLNFPGVAFQEAMQGRNSSKYTGVSWSIRRNNWRAQIIIAGKDIHLGHFDDEEDAARKYDDAAAPLRRPVNFRAEGQLEVFQVEKASNYKGVNWANRSNNRSPQIRIDGKDAHLGAFDDEKESALKYDEASVPLEKPLNFSVEGQLGATKGASSRFKGVCWYSKKNKFVAQINVHGKGTHLGYFDDEEEAARKYDEAAAPLGRPLNFPGVGCQEAMQGRNSSKYKGVSWSIRRNNWRAQIRIAGKDIHLGHFDDEEDAARKYDDAAAPLGRPLNFTVQGQLKAVKGGRGGSSRFKGVCWKRKRNKWVASLTIDSKSVHLGFFDDEEEAARKYDEAAAPLGRPLNFAVEGQVEAVKGGSSRFKGVCWRSNKNKWVASINTNGKQIHLGYFGDKEEPARKYDEAVAPFFRPTNFPRPAQTLLANAKGCQQKQKPTAPPSPGPPAVAPAQALWLATVAQDAVLSNSSSSSSRSSINSSTTSSAAAAVECVSAAAEAAYGRVPVVDCERPGAASQLRENRLSGVPTVLVGHRGWAAFADAWLVPGHANSSGTTSGSVNSANSCNRGGSSAADTDLAISEEDDAEEEEEEALASASSTEAAQAATLAAMAAAAAEWVPSAAEVAAAAAHGVCLDALLADIGGEVVPLVQPRCFDGAQRMGHLPDGPPLACAAAAPVRDFVRRAWLAGTPDWYMHQWQFPLSPSAAPALCHRSKPLHLLGDDLTKHWLDACRGDSPFQYLFFGHRGSFTQLHRDPGGLDIVLQALTGRKECLLVHRDDSPATYRCAVNLDAPNLNAHPLFAFARVWRHVLMPGELLHLPAGTFHFCRNLDPCLSYSRFHLDAVNLPHFYKSYIDGDAPEIDHGALLWNAAYETIRALEAGTEAAEAVHKASFRPASAAAAVAAEATAAAATATEAMARQAQSLAALRHTFAALHQRRTGNGPHTWALLIHDVDVCLADFHAAFGTTCAMAGQHPPHWWQPGVPQSSAEAAAKADRVFNASLAAGAPQQLSSAPAADPSLPPFPVRPPRASSNNSSGGGAAGSAAGRWQVGDRAMVVVARRHLVATVVAVLGGGQEAAVVRYDGWPQRFDELQRRNDLRTVESHELGPFPAPFPTAVLVRWGAARELYRAFVVGTYVGPLLRVTYEAATEDWDQWVKPRQLHPLL